MPLPPEPAATKKPEPGLTARLWQDFISACKIELPHWVYISRALLALFITGWFALRFNLSSPVTAMLTTILILNRQSGMVIAKAFYRTIGTVIGVTASIMLMSLYGQHRELFLLGFAIWIAFCTAGAGYLRNFKSYAFVLSGYTTCFITLPIIHNPLGTFDAAVARGSEVMLAIIVTTVIHEVVFPERMGQTLWQQVQKEFSSLLSFMRAHAPGSLDEATLMQSLLDFTRQAVTLEDTRSSAIFESTDIMGRSGRFQRVNQRFMEVCSSLNGLHEFAERIRRQGLDAAYQPLAGLYHELIQLLGDEPWEARHSAQLLARLRPWRIQLAQRAERISQALEQAHPAQKESCRTFATASALLAHVTDGLIEYAAIADRLYHARPSLFISRSVSFTRFTDYAPAFINATRAFVSILLMGWYWFESGWPSGQNALLNIAIYCALFASMPSPASAMLQVGYGYVVGTLAIFLFHFFIMPQLDGYLLLMLGYLPFVLVGLVLMTRTGWYAVGLGYCICFVYTAGLTNVEAYDPVSFMNGALGQLVGIAVSIGIYMVVPGAGAFKWVNQRLQHQLDRLVLRAATGSVEGLSERFESQTRDLFSQLMGAILASESNALMLRALAAYEAGRSVVDIRLELAQAKGLSSGLTQAVREAVDSVALFYLHTDEMRYQQALKVVVNADETAREQLPSRAALARFLHVLRSAIEDSGRRLVANAG